MKKLGIAFFCIIFIGALNGCLSKEDLDEAQAAAITATGTFDTAAGALETAGDVFSNSVLPASGSCEEMVTDLTVDGDEVSEYIGCLLETNTKNPETLRGSIHLVGEVISMIESSISFEYDSSYTTHTNISGNVDTSDGVQAVVLDLQEKALNSSSWDYLVEICILSLDGNTMNASISDCQTGAFTFTVFLKETDGKMGFKTIENFGGFGGGSSFVLDFLNQQIRFEMWDANNGRHSRAYITGAVSENYDLGTVTGVTIAIADQGIENSGDGTDAIYGSYDGTNLCLNTWDDNDSDHSNGAGNATTNLTGFGTCSSFPSYNGGFFPPAPSGLETFLMDENKGLLSFTSATFSISDYFINN